MPIYFYFLVGNPDEWHATNDTSYDPLNDKFIGQFYLKDSNKFYLYDKTNFKSEIDEENNKKKKGEKRGEYDIMFDELMKDVLSAPVFIYKVIFLDDNTTDISNNDSRLTYLYTEGR